MPGLFDLDGNFWTRMSYSYQSEIWNGTDALADFVNAGTPEERADALDQRLPSFSTATLQLGYTATSGWEASLVVRNLFDESGYNYLGTSDYGDYFGDARFRYVRTLQRPRTISLSFSKKW
jgi:outer membrane receptor protein involved in Fe transport